MVSLQRKRGRFFLSETKQSGPVYQNRLTATQEGMPRLEKAENPCAITPLQQEGNLKSNRWEMLSLEEALYPLEEGMPPLPSVEILACILHKLKYERNVAHALCFHAFMLESGLEAHTPLGDCLISMLVEIGRLCHAQQVFDRLVCRDVCSWNTLIAGYVKHGESQHALTLYQKMQEDDSLHPSDHTFVALLKACTRLKDMQRGQEIHAEIARRGVLESNSFVGSTLVDMYAKHGSFAKAQEVFDKLWVRNTVSWTALIAGYVEHGCGEEALICFEQMQHEGVVTDAVTLVCSLKACGSMGAADKGREIHAEIVRKGLERDLVVGSTLVDMYAKCGLLAKAQDVFDKLLVQDVVSWNALMAGYVEHRRYEEAFRCFKLMRYEGVSPDAVTFVCILKACGNMRATDKGQDIHAEIVRKQLELDLFVGNTLVDMYAKCGLLAEAQEVFKKLPARLLVSWNALITGVVEHGLGEEALNCFEQMKQEDVSPDAVTYVCILKACGSIETTDKGQGIHAEIARKGFETDLFVGSTLVDMYAKCGSLLDAQDVFNMLPVRIVVSWNALIAGYAEHEHGEEALHCFERMLHEGISPDDATFVCSLKACGLIGATAKGQALHAEIARKGLESDILVGNTLVDMYAKCASLSEAQEEFDKLQIRTIVSWNALIAGYAQLGESEIVFHTFDRMIGEGKKPTLVTFVSVLNACNHAGLVDKGQMYFEAMRKDYGINPTLKHYTCMVDLLGRAGHVDKAVVMIKKMPFHPGIVVWHTLLGACRKWGNVELGRQAFEHAMRLDEKDDAAYIVMFNVYADADMHEEANKVEAMRLENKLRKARTVGLMPQGL